MDKIAIIGAGPAGMGCAFSLAKSGQDALVIDLQNIPGGLCRTINFKGYLFDIGGHRFISKSKEVNALWDDVMNDDLRLVKRLSRIYYNKRYFNYPLSFFNVFWNLGIKESFLCVASYLKHKYFPVDDNLTFQGWIVNNFGKRLYDIFFKSYTEKVWGVACNDISADWAKQRINGLSLRVAIRDAIFKKHLHKTKTLSKEFKYPRNGPGEFFSRLKELTTALGTDFLLNHQVESIEHANGKVFTLVIRNLKDNQLQRMPVDYLFSSLPLPVCVKLLNPAAPLEVLLAAQRLKFRNFLVVNVILNKKDIFKDQWIYVHSPNVKMGRIQNYKNWSMDMVLDLDYTSLGLEYFCNEQDSLWSMPDAELISFALKELEKIGIASAKLLVDACVVRVPEAYPFYSLNYQDDKSILREYLDSFTNLQTMGRAGLFRYDNSDHALLSGMFAASNFMEKESKDLWSINLEEAYLEA